MLVVKSTKNIILVLNSDVINTVIRYLLFRLCVWERMGGRERGRGGETVLKISLRAKGNYKGCRFLHILPFTLIPIKTESWQVWVLILWGLQPHILFIKCICLAYKVVWMSVTLPRRGCLEQMFTFPLNLRQSPLPLCTFKLLSSFEQIADLCPNLVFRVFNDLLSSIFPLIFFSRIQRYSHVSKVEL